VTILAWIVVVFIGLFILMLVVESIRFASTWGGVE